MPVFDPGRGEGREEERPINGAKESRMERWDLLLLRLS